MDGYLKLPPAGAGPGLIVLQEWWGINEHVRDVVDRFAKLGYVAFAPDLFHGKMATKPSDAERLMMSLHIEQTAADLKAAIDSLLGMEEVHSEKLGIVGFCMGGQLALFAACKHPEIGACIDFYGVHPNFKPDLTNLGCPLLGLFGEKDTFVCPDKVHDLSAALKEAKKTYTFHTFEGAGHAFFNDTREEAYDEESAVHSWEMCKKFLNRHIT